MNKAYPKDMIVIRIGDSYTQSSGDRIEAGFYYKVECIIDNEGVELEGVGSGWTWKLFKMINQR